ncbi:MAG: arginyltransferase [Alphaproteobacteria bacterium]|nr:arginyltransferase [Alphaproteobacteria bacterium]
MNSTLPTPPALVQIFRTLPAPCPYLPGRVERRLVVDLSHEDAADRFAELSHAGFRRSHNYAYRPACPGCVSCVAVRVDVAAFRPNRTLRRIANANADLAGRLTPARATGEQFDLFRRYQRARHGEGDMAQMRYGDYRAMVNETPVETGILEYRDEGGMLRAVCLVDQLPDGPSAVYSFFEPTMPRRSLGSFIILDLISRARAAGQPHVYLGYWIEGSQKMSYKARFAPLEALGAATWAPMSVAGSRTG